METDRMKWNKKFSSRNDTPQSTEPFVIQSEKLLKSGSVLDIACGDGRNSLYLASQGYQVTGVDISDVALKRFQQFARFQNVQINTDQLDLDSAEPLKQFGLFDNMILMYFKPSSNLWDQLVLHLEKEGILLYCNFNIKQHKVHSFSERYTVIQEELFHIHPQLELLSYESIEEPDKFLDRYAFKRIYGKEFTT